MQLEYEREVEHEEILRPENEDQERRLDHELEDLDMNYGDASGCDRDENTYLHEFTIPFSHSPPPEPGPSHVSRRSGACAVFQTVAQETDSERSEDEHEKIQDKKYQDTYLRFEPDAESESADSDSEEEDHYWLQDERLHPAEETQDLEEQQELDNLGSRIFSQWEKDNLKAAAYKVTHQVTREAFEGLRHLTDSCMDVRSEFVAN